MATYAAMIEIMDSGIGKVIQTLKDKGMYEHTLFLFMSDNGSTSEGGFIKQLMADLSNTPIAVTNNGYSKEEPVPLSSLQTEEAKARQKKAVSVGNPVISLIFFPPAWILLPHITPTRFTIKK